MSRSSNPFEAYATNPFEAFTKLPVMPDFSVVPTWTTAAMQVAQKSTVIALATPQVIAMRLTMMAMKPGDAKTNRESHRMVAEKIDAVQESSAQITKLATTLAASWPKLWTDPKAADRMLKQALTGTNRAMSPFHRRVTSNVKRLSK